MMVDLKTKEPPARSLLNRADQEFPSLMTQVSRWRWKVAQGNIHVQNVFEAEGFLESHRGLLEVEQVLQLFAGTILCIAFY
jgi:hypothetical protein